MEPEEEEAATAYRERQARLDALNLAIQAGICADIEELITNATRLYAFITNKDTTSNG